MDRETGRHRGAYPLLLTFRYTKCLFSGYTIALFVCEDAPECMCLPIFECFLRFLTKHLCNFALDNSAHHPVSFSPKTISILEIQGLCMTLISMVNEYPKNIPELR